MYVRHRSLPPLIVRHSQSALSILLLLLNLNFNCSALPPCAYCPRFFLLHIQTLISFHPVVHPAIHSNQADFFFRPRHSNIVLIIISQQSSLASLKFQEEKPPPWPYNRASPTGWRGSTGWVNRQLDTKD